MMFLAASAALACHGAPPKADCQCLCPPSETQAAGLIYLCKQRRWFCPKPAAAVAPPRKAKAKPRP
jgi:hypothetical protein